MIFNLYLFTTISVADPDPGSGAFLIPGSGICENQDPDQRSWICGMNIPDHINNFFGLKILKFFDVYPGSRIFLAMDPGSVIEKFGSEINIPDPQH